MSANRFIVGCAILFSMAAMQGCGDSNGGRMEVRGEIKLKNAPLDQGTISFRPLPGSKGSASGAQITNGKYELKGDGGLLPGKYKVIITSGDGKTMANPDEPPGPGGNIISKDRIPPEYNEKSKVEVEVKDKGPNVFDYDIK